LEFQAISAARDDPAEREHYAGNYQQVSGAHYTRQRPREGEYDRVGQDAQPASIRRDEHVLGCGDCLPHLQVFDVSPAVSSDGILLDGHQSAVGDHDRQIESKADEYDPHAEELEITKKKRQERKMRYGDEYPQ